MKVPMVNVRKAPGHRGEGAVARMRALSLVGAPEYHVSQTGTVDRKRFTGSGSSRQPIRAMPSMGGLPSFSFGD